MPKICLILLILVSCRKLDQKENLPNELNLSISSDVETLDPANAYDTVSGSVLYQIHETLFEYHYLKRPYLLRPLLSEGMPIVQNEGKRYIFKIKKNVKYHPSSCLPKGRTLRAQDFIVQLKRLAYIPSRSNGYWLIENKVKGVNKFRKAAKTLEDFEKLNISGISAPDDHTLVIDLEHPDTQFLFAFAMTHTSPVPMELVKCHKNTLSSVAVGTGPFMLNKKIKGLIVSLKKFEDYRQSAYPSEGDRFAQDNGLLKDSGKKIPFLDGVNFHIIKSSQTRWLNFLAKKIDVLGIRNEIKFALTPEGKLSKELKDKKVHLQVAPTLTYWWLAFNMRDEIVGKNKNLRMAIAHAINIEKYIQLFTNKAGQRANSIYPPGIPGYNPSQKLPYTYDLNKAKEYLRLAGYPGGKGLPTLRYDVRGKDTVRRQEAEYIKAELKKIGVNLQVELNTFPTFLKKARLGNLQFWQGGWALDYPDSENIIQLLATPNHPPGPNTTYFSNPSLDAQFQKLKTLDNGISKTKIMGDIEKLVNNHLPWIMTYYAHTYILTQDHLKNFRYSDLAANKLKYLKIFRK